VSTHTPLPAALGAADSPPCARAREATTGAVTVRLAPEQLERLASLVAERLGVVSGRSELVDAAELARMLGTSRAWVYRNAARLGARRLGDGVRGRLRFDLEAARAATSRLAVEPSQDGNPSAVAEFGPRSRSRRGRSPGRSPDPGSILTPRPRRAAEL
jgi:hypothetical protein